MASDRYIFIQFFLCLFPFVVLLCLQVFADTMGMTHAFVADAVISSSFIFLFLFLFIFGIRTVLYRIWQCKLWIFCRKQGLLLVELTKNLTNIYKHRFFNNSVIFNLFADPPIVTLRLGSTLSAEDIKEGDDVYFECHVSSNPPWRRLLWLYDVSY